MPPLVKFTVLRVAQMQDGPHTFKALLSALQGGNCHLYLRAELWLRRAQGPDGGGEADV